MLNRRKNKCKNGRSALGMFVELHVQCCCYLEEGQELKADKEKVVILQASHPPFKGLQILLCRQWSH